MNIHRFKHLVRKAFLSIPEVFRKDPFIIRMVKAAERNSVYAGCTIDDIFVGEMESSLKLYMVILKGEDYINAALLKEVRKYLPSKGSLRDEHHMGDQLWIFYYSTEEVDTDSFLKRFPSVEITHYKYKVNKIEV